MIFLNLLNSFRFQNLGTFLTRNFIKNAIFMKSFNIFLELFYDFSSFLIVFLMNFLLDFEFCVIFLHYFLHWTHLFFYLL